MELFDWRIALKKTPCSIHTNNYKSLISETSVMAVYLEESQQDHSCSSISLPDFKLVRQSGDSNCCAVMYKQYQKGLHSNPGEALKFVSIVHLSPGSTLNSGRATSPLEKLVKRKIGGMPLSPPLGCSFSNCDETELSRIVTCMVLKATAYEGLTSSPLP
ncbi:hypothetical protein TNCV_3559011 [Trichonephila clavipes]|uniref:Uncharacterized protein n=1 Tax=Trichonephila clavipes TaxID=2585209 RepID=A0A8X6WCB1_TRICX|nr:hypothetical protein TNCV_3559011 [Trichonephila clavipes]